MSDLNTVDNINDNVLFLRSLTNDLKGRRVLSASWEAESLVKHFGRMSRIDLFTGDKPISARAKRSIQKAVKYRLKGKPLCYLLKECYFFGYRFFVNDSTLIPRPETELLVEETIKILDEIYLRKPLASSSKGSANTNIPNILDVGTGTGCIAVSLTLERPECRMTALDISSRALNVARKNAAYHGLSKKIRLVKSDLFQLFGKKETGHWDIIVSNPPYIPEKEMEGLPLEVLCEPRLALNGGKKGLVVIELMLDQVASYLKKGGWFLAEIGKGHSGPLAEKIAKDGFFKNLRFVKDYRGIDRILIAQRSQ